MEGSYLRVATQVLVEDGACLEETWPYQADRDYLRRKPSTAAFNEARKYRVPRQLQIQPATDWRSIREQISLGHPIGGSFPLFKSNLYSLRFHQDGRLLLRLGQFDPVKRGPGSEHSAV